MKGIEHSVEEEPIRNWGSDAFGTIKYRLWIQDEDRVTSAQELLNSFLEDPSSHPINPSLPQDTVFIEHPPITAAQRFLEKKIKKQLAAEKRDANAPPKIGLRLTNFLIALCCSLLLFEMMTMPDIAKIPPPIYNKILAVSPIEKALLFDYPESYVLLDKIAGLYGYQALLKPDELPPPGHFLYEKYKQTAHWEGLYPTLVRWGQQFSNKEPLTGALFQPELFFEKIKEGELWRLVSPIILHGDILHLFFNMIWLLILGSQIESRVGGLRYLLFIVIVAIVSNTLQYLVSGPAFIGFSGVICGFAFFIRARQKSTPWEAYNMTSSTFYFILFFISILALLSTITFVLNVFQLGTIPIGIANTAHFAGAMTGYFLGRLNFFRWQPNND